MRQHVLEPGIYFGLDKEEYHADPALNYSSMCTLLKSPYRFWMESTMNPNRKRQVQTPEMKLGNAFDTLLLEPQKFYQQYNIVPVDEWDDRKIMISKNNYDTIKAMVTVLKETESTNVLLSVGLPQVVIIWDDPVYKIRMKAMHDLFQPRASIDVKSIHGVDDIDIKSSIWKYSYHIQCAHYIYSRIMARRLLNDKRSGFAVFGNISDAFIQEFLDEKQDLFVHIFQEDEVPYQARILAFDEETRAKGEADTQKAISAFVSCKNKFGTKPWGPEDKGIEQFSMFNGAHL